MHPTRHQPGADSALHRLYCLLLSVAVVGVLSFAPLHLHAEHEAVLACDVCLQADTAAVLENPATGMPAPAGAVLVADSASRTVAAPTLPYRSRAPPTA